DVARLRGGRARRRGRRISGARATLRRAAGSGGGMSAISGRTRLGLEILGAGAALGVAGDTLLRAMPWGLNALICTTGLVGAAAALVRRHRVLVSSDAPWLAAAALLIGSNFVARDRKSTRLNSSHVSISYAVFCLKKKKQTPFRSLSVTHKSPLQKPCQLVRSLRPSLVLPPIPLNPERIRFSSKSGQSILHTTSCF